MSKVRPIAATLTASGIGRSMSITSCPASRAALTRSIRSGLRSSSTISAPPHSWGGAWRSQAEGLRRTGSSSPLFDVLPRRAQQAALEVMTDQRAAGLEQVVEGLQELALRGLGLAALGLDPLAHVVIEQVDRLARGPIDGRRMLLAEFHQAAERASRGDTLHA